MAHLRRTPASHRSRRGALPRRAAACAPARLPSGGAAIVLALGLAASLAVALSGCGRVLNSPYPASDDHANIIYASFDEEPKHLDTAISYSSDGLALLCNIVEPPLTYHFLKRPYELEPLVATEVPTATTREVAYNGETVEATVYTVHIKPGIVYARHPCFVPGNLTLTEEDVRGIDSVTDFTNVDTRELVAADFVYAIRRLADPRLTCPILSTLEQNLLGYTEFADSVSEALDAERDRRAAEGGPLYNREQDEKYSPVHLDYEAFPLLSAAVVDRYTFELVLCHPYPQMLYWLAMPFFAPVPPEQVLFFEQTPLLERNMTFDKNALGTGPYTLAEFDPTNEFVLARNEDYREDTYPDLPPPDPSNKDAVALYDELKAAGMMDDVGRPLPIVDRIVYRREPEWIPRWAKFRQGYYDSSGISSDVFDQSVKLTSKGDALLSDDMQSQGIKLYTSPAAEVGYFAFNMEDPVVGGLDDAHRKLRQAISIAFDVEQDIAIFSNGRGTVAHSPTPPGIFGYESGREGMDPVTHTWDEATGRAVRRPLEDAKRLMAEAGYSDGYGPDGKPLTLYFDNAWTDTEARPLLRFVINQFAKLGIQLESRTTDYNRFQDKVQEGSFQILSWGWIADYPDPENFAFLLYGPNGRSEEGAGANSSNYASPEYDALFEQMRNMENGDERLAIIRKMDRVYQEDAPWFGCIHGVSYSLVHDWYRNAYPNTMGYAHCKYLRVDAELRAKRRQEWNTPRWQPPVILVVVILLTALPAIRVALRHLREA
jgi:oligopeptide transport system substrate-binding protein